MKILGVKKQQFSWLIACIICLPLVYENFYYHWIYAITMAILVFSIIYIGYKIIKYAIDIKS